MSQDQPEQESPEASSDGPSVEIEDTEQSKSSKKIKIGASHVARFKSWYKTNKKLSIPITALVIFLIILVVPWSRYQIAGLVIKKDVAIFVTDSKTNSVVSSAVVELGGKSTETNGQGKALFKAVPVGPKNVKVIKKYYQDAGAKVTVGFSGAQRFNLSATATGRQVKVNITNTINKKVLAGVTIKVADVSAKTDTSGNAVIVLRAGTTSKPASFSLSGYNDASATIKVDDNSVLLNNFTLTPVGKVYFLSKLSGNIDVVKTNLDGTNRQTVYAGTGKEEDGGTVLLASRDWKYLALLSKHDSDQPQLYLIETATDKVSVMDQGNAAFTLVGWSNDSFVYQVTRNSYANWQSKKFALKSFNADSKQLAVLDQTDAAGDANQYAQEQLGNAYITADGTVVYHKDWYKYSSNYYQPNDQANGKQNGIYSIRTDGSGKKTLKNFDVSTANGYSNYINSQSGKPDEVYYSHNDGGSNSSYYEYKNGSLQTISSDAYPNSGIYNTYLQSPTGNQTFWSEQRDGKNTLFIGNQDGDGGKTIAALSDYQTYGWYSDNYLLVSKNSSELYILPVTGLADGQSPIKITDYHKPVQNYYGYGGGYGGI